MKMNKHTILITFPSDEISNSFWLEKNIIILNYEGIYYFDEKQKKRVKYNSNNIFYELNEIRDLLNWWGPIIERWKGKAIQYEELRLKICHLVNYLTSAFKDFNIKKIIHFTGLPHHLDSITVDIAANINKIKQIYFYVNVIDGGIIPIEHEFDIKNRKILFSKKNRESYNEKINQFILNNLSGKSPEVNSSIDNYKKSYKYIYLLLTLKWIKNKIFRSKKKSNLDNKMFFFKEDDFSHEDLFEIIKRQKDFIFEYRKKEIDFRNIIKNKGLPKIIIYGNYQPEATSFPEGVNYSNHIDIILKLRKIGFYDDIYYKEHPASFMYIDTPSIFLTKVSMYKNSTFLKLLDLYNCKLVNTNFNAELHSQYIDNYLVITISGTIAIERSLKGYKTIICGNPYFKNMPGLIELEKLNSFNDIYQIDLKFDEKIMKESKKFLAELLGKSVINNPLGIGSGKKNEHSIKDMIDFINLNN